nr:RecName: Full=Antifungal lectin AMML [Astragalus mongholicus]
ESGINLQGDATLANN